MIKFKRILCLVLCLSLFAGQAFGYANLVVPSDTDIINKIEKTYGVNIILPEDSDYKYFSDCMLILERSLKKFPQNMIKEITDYYNSKGIKTNIILDKTENIEDLFSLSVNDDSSVNIYIKALKGSLYSESCFASEEAVIHDLGHFISDYVFKIYDFKKIEGQFNRLNGEYKYGTWEEGYCKVFVNKHSAASFKDDVSDLIWYAEAHPSKLRNINMWEGSVIHDKLSLIRGVFDEVFSSVSENTRLWNDAIPQKPQAWAESAIWEMKNSSLIPEEFNGLYDAYITREDFYLLVLNLLNKKVGQDNIDKYFQMADYEEHLALDPVKGEIFVDDGVRQSSYYNSLCTNNETLNLAYHMGIINSEYYKEPEAYMTRLEIAKILVYIGSQLGVDFTNYQPLAYKDLEEVAENEKPYIYMAAGKGVLRGDGLNFKPFDYCTYQEAYIILMRFYNLF